MVSFTPTGQNVVISHTVLLRLVLWISVLHFKKKINKILFPPSFEPGTFCVLGERDNDYTTGTNWELSPLPSGNIIPPSTLLWIWDWQQQHRGNQGSASPMELHKPQHMQRYKESWCIGVHHPRCSLCTGIPLSCPQEHYTWKHFHLTSVTDAGLWKDSCLQNYVSVKCKKKILLRCANLSPIWTFSITCCSDLVQLKSSVWTLVCFVWL